MTLKRLIAITFIFTCTTIAWILLGASLTFRTDQAHRKLDRIVPDNWSPPQTQVQPQFFLLTDGMEQPIHAEDTKIRVNLVYEPKRKGLLWYRTYGVTFNARYSLKNLRDKKVEAGVRYQFPVSTSDYHNFQFIVGGEPYAGEIHSGAPLILAFEIEPNEIVDIEIAYRSRGIGTWRYGFYDHSRVRNFTLEMHTNFKDFDIPADTGSPTDRRLEENGWVLNWDYGDVIGARPIGMGMPKVLNPGPVASRITYFAPFSLLFFFTILVILDMIKGSSLHPMHYFFVAAGTFAFQLLFAYLVDVTSIFLAFGISAAVSLIIVNLYLKAICGLSFSRFSTLAQFCYITLFSATFFLDGLTGLSITIGAIVTLCILMATTTKVDWTKKFQRKPKMV